MLTRSSDLSRLYTAEPKPTSANSESVLSKMAPQEDETMALEGTREYRIQQLYKQSMYKKLNGANSLPPSSQDSVLPAIVYKPSPSVARDRVLTTRVGKPFVIQTLQSPVESEVFSSILKENRPLKHDGNSLRREEPAHQKDHASIVPLLPRTEQEEIEAVLRTHGIKIRDFSYPPPSVTPKEDRQPSPYAASQEDRQPSFLSWEPEV